MLEKISSGGTHPTHLAINDKGTALYVANYGIPYGTFSVFNLDKVSGKIGILGPSYTNTYGAGSNVVPDRQEYSHPHAVITWRDKKKLFLSFCQFFEDLWPFSIIFGNYPVSPLYIYVVDLGADKIYHYSDELSDDGTGKSLSEVLIFASTNPQYDDRLFIELQVQIHKNPKLEPGENMLCTEIVSDIQNNFCTQHVLPMFCKRKNF